MTFADQDLLGEFDGDGGGRRPRAALSSQIFEIRLFKFTVPRPAPHRSSSGSCGRKKKFNARSLSANMSSSEKPSYAAACFYASRRIIAFGSFNSASLVYRIKSTGVRAHRIQRALPVVADRVLHVALQDADVKLVPPRHLLRVRRLHCPRLR